MTKKLHNDGKVINVEGRLSDLQRVLCAERSIIALYIYGSYGTSDQTPLSDIDLALIFRPDELPDLDAQLDLIGKVSEALDVEDVSVTILNRAPVLMQRKVLRTGRQLFVSDEIAHADFVERVIDQAADFDIDHQRFLREYDAALVEDHGAGRSR